MTRIVSRFRNTVIVKRDIFRRDGHYWIFALSFCQLDFLSYWFFVDVVMHLYFYIEHSTLKGNWKNNHAKRHETQQMKMYLKTFRLVVSLGVFWNITLCKLFKRTDLIKISLYLQIIFIKKPLRDRSFCPS